MNYYKQEIEKLGKVVDMEYPVKIQIASEDGKTKWLDINEESGPEIIKYVSEIVSIEGFKKALARGRELEEKARPAFGGLIELSRLTPKERKEYREIVRKYGK